MLIVEETLLVGAYSKLAAGLFKTSLADAKTVAMQIASDLFTDISGLTIRIGETCCTNRVSLDIVANPTNQTQHETHVTDL